MSRLFRAIFVVRPPQLHQRCVSSTCLRNTTSHKFLYLKTGPAYSTRSHFRTMVVARSGQSASRGEAREFDPEIKDIASYVHSHEITSDLAVRRAVKSEKDASLMYASSLVRNCTIRLSRHHWLRPGGSTIQRMHKATGADCGGHGCPQRKSCTRNTVRPRSSQWRI